MALKGIDTDVLDKIEANKRLSTNDIINSIKYNLQDLEPLVTDAWNDGWGARTTWDANRIPKTRSRTEFLKSKNLIS